MSPLNVLANPETHLRTLRANVNALDAELVKAKDILQANEDHLTSGSFSAVVLKTLKDRLHSLQTRLQDEIVDKRMPAKGRQLVDEIEACISAGLTALSSDLLDRYSIEIAEQSLATTRIEKIIREACALNHDICGATHKTSGRVDR